MDAMAGTTAVAVDADVVITTDAVEEIPSVKASARDTGRATMMHCGTAAAAAVDAVVVVMAAVAAVLAAVAAAVVVAVVAMVAVAVLMAGWRWMQLAIYSHASPGMTEHFPVQICIDRYK